MNYLTYTIIMIAFFGLIAFSVYFLESGWPLFLLLLTPSYKTK